MQKWFVLLMLLAVALSGCASEVPDEGTDDAGDDGTGDGSGTDDGNETADDGDGPVDAGGNATDGTGGANATNEAPVVTFTADVVNGTAPLLVNFTLDVEDDSENLTWTFFVDGNETLSGTDVPAAFNHTFDVGVWQAVMVVADDVHSVEENLTINVTQAIEEEPEPVRYEGSYDGSASPLTTSADTCVGDGIDCAKLVFTGNHDGRPFARSPGNSNYYVDFLSDCDDTSSSLGIFNDDGTVPDGSACAYMWYYGLGPVSVALTIS